MSPRAKRQADVVVQLEERQRALRERARRAFGVTGGTEPAPGLRDAIGGSPVGWYPLVALSLLVVVDQFQAFGVSVLGPEISRTLGVGRSVLALLLVLQALSVSVAALPFAALVQRRARRAAVSIVTAFAWSATVWPLARSKLSTAHCSSTATDPTPACACCRSTAGRRSWG